MTDYRPWLDEAECVGIDPELFFPEKHFYHAYKFAREICTDCPVRKQCLEDTLAFEGSATSAERFGFVGGMSPDARRKEYIRRLAVKRAGASGSEGLAC